MMHCDYQLAYCLTTYTLALAHADRAFKNDRLNPRVHLPAAHPWAVAHTLHSLERRNAVEARNMPLGSYARIILFRHIS